MRCKIDKLVTGLSFRHLVKTYAWLSKVRAVSTTDDLEKSLKLKNLLRLCQIRLRGTRNFC